MQGKLTVVIILSPPLSPPRPATETTKARVNRKDSVYMKRKEEEEEGEARDDVKFEFYHCLHNRTLKSSLVQAAWLGLQAREVVGVN